MSTFSDRQLETRPPVSGRTGRSRIARLAVCVVALIGAVSCARGRLPELPPSRWDEAERWPQRPGRGRIFRVGEIRNSADIVESPGFMSRLADTVLGESPPVSLSRPMGVAIDRNGRVVVADPGLAAVVVFDPTSGDTLLLDTTPDGRMLSPIGVACDDESNIYVTDSARAEVIVFDADGSHRLSFGRGQLQRPTGIAFDAARRQLLVVDTLTHEVGIFDTQGTKLAVFGGRGDGEAELNFPVFLALGTRGQRWIVDAMNARVQRYDAEGEHVGGFGQRGDSAGYFANPKGIALDSDGNVYVADALFDNIQIFDPDGRILLHFGRHGSGAAGLTLPEGIAIDTADRVFVADSLNHRIQIYRYVSELPP